MVETALEEAARLGVLLLEPRQVFDPALEDVIVPRNLPFDRWPRLTNTPCAVYSRSKCIAALMAAGGLGYSDAAEWYTFNTSGAWMGEGTPTFLEPCDEPNCNCEHVPFY